MADIVLLGGTGAMGRAIAALLHAQQRPFRVVARSRSRLDALFAAYPEAELKTWNPEQPESARAALSGARMAFCLFGLPYWRFRDFPLLMRQTLDAAVAAGVARMLLVSSVYSYGVPRSTPVAEDHAREPATVKGQMRKRQEDMLLAADAAGRIRGTILRLPDFYGPGVETSIVNGVFQAAVKGKAAPLLAPIDTPHEFVYVPDAAAVALRLAAEPRAYGRAWNLAGPGPISERQFAEKVFAAAGRPPALRPVGLWTLRTLGLFNRVLRELVEMHYLQTTPVLLDDSALRGLLGPLPKTSYDEGIRATLAALPRPEPRRAG